MENKDINIINELKRIADNNDMEQTPISAAILDIVKNAELGDTSSIKSKVIKLYGNLNNVTLDNDEFEFRKINDKQWELLHKLIRKHKENTDNSLTKMIERKSFLEKEMGRKIKGISKVEKFDPNVLDDFNLGDMQQELEDITKKLENVYKFKSTCDKLRAQIFSRDKRFHSLYAHVFLTDFVYKLVLYYLEGNLENIKLLFASYKDDTFEKIRECIDAIVDNDYATGVKTDEEFEEFLREIAELDLDTKRSQLEQFKNLIELILIKLHEMLKIELIDVSDVENGMTEEEKSKAMIDQIARKLLNKDVSPEVMEQLTDSDKECIDAIVSFYFQWKESNIDMIQTSLNEMEGTIKSESIARWIKWGEQTAKRIPREDYRIDRILLMITLSVSKLDSIFLFALLYNIIPHIPHKK